MAGIVGFGADGCPRGANLASALGLLQQAIELGAIHQLHVSSFGKRHRIGRECPRCNDESAGRALGRHHAIELADDVYADLEGLPLLALNEEFLIALAQNKIDTTVRASPAEFRHAVALEAKRLADQQLELSPRHSVEGFGPFR